jgi:hypothetical protein
MPNPLYDDAQDFYQPYGDEIPNSQEVWQASQDISPSLESLLMDFMQLTEDYMLQTQATLKNHDASLRNLEEQIGQVGMKLSLGPNKMSPNEITCMHLWC